MVNVVHVNHPQTIPPPQSIENFSSMKLVPSAKKVGDHSNIEYFNDLKMFLPNLIPAKVLIAVCHYGIIIYVSYMSDFV